MQATDERPQVKDTENSGAVNTMSQVQNFIQFTLSYAATPNYIQQNNDSVTAGFN